MKEYAKIAIVALLAVAVVSRIGAARNVVFGSGA